MMSVLRISLKVNKCSAIVVNLSRNEGGDNYHRRRDTDRADR